MGCPGSVSWWGRRLGAASIASSVWLVQPAPLAAQSFERVTLSREFLCEGASFADLDRDGHQDVIAGPYWWRGPGFDEKREIYEPKPFDPAGYSDNFFAFPHDFDRDGWTDVLFVGFPGEAAAWYANPRGGDRRWERHVVFEHVDGESPAWTDLTGDGLPELVFLSGGRLGWAGPGGNDPAAAWSFHPLSEDLGLERFTHGLGVGDVDGDGRADVLLKDGWWRQPESLAGDPAWGRHPFAFSERHGGAQMFTYDVDGDGDSDVITSLAAHEFGLSWWEQVQEPGAAKDASAVGFVEHRIMDDEPSESADAVRFGELHALDLVDIDGDGLQDILTGKRWWSHGAEGDPDRGAVGAVVYAFRLTRPSAGEVRYVAERLDDDSGVGVQVVAGDVTGDGRPDVVIGNKKGVFLLRQRSVPRKVLSEAEKIEALLVAVETSGLVFVRNDEEHDARAAGEHLRRKLRAADENLTARRFIEEIASRSSMSGRPYEVLLSDGRRVLAETWFLERLAELDRGGSPADRKDAFVPPTGQGTPIGRLPTGADGRPLNLDFERGDLTDWVVEGEAFRGQPIRGDTVGARGREPALPQGEYWIGGYELAGDGQTGALTSVPFRVTAPYASFLVGGGAYERVQVQIHRMESDTGASTVIFRTSAMDHETLQRAVVDLRAELGREIFVRLADDQDWTWGHVNFDDFLFHDEEPAFAVPSGVPPLLAFDEIEHDGLEPREAAAAMTVPPGFRVDLVASEPELHQPIALAVDARGRLWVAEAFTYPVRAPEGEGRDDLLVFEDRDRDGAFESRTVFASGLNLVSGLELGFGGVWVGAAPNLFFIPDRDDDLVPDGPPEVVLDGWGYEDTHETLNSFTWGPDGWLYGCHGVFTNSTVGAPGTSDEERVPLNAGVWRYHPTRKAFEVFAWGTSNPWGLDFDAHGQALVTACVIPHLFHLAQGGRYLRQAGSHFDPHVFEDIPTIADHRHYLGDNPHGGNLRSNAAGGGHAHCGALIYQADLFPEEYRGLVLMNNIHGNRVNADRLDRAGSGLVGRHASDVLLANDRWFRGISLELGPEGSLYFIDWYDRQACHDQEPAHWDRTNGRLYRLTYGPHRPLDVNLPALSSEELVRLCFHSNEWFARRARVLLQERGPDARVHTLLRRILLERGEERRILRALWALHATGGLDERLAREILASPHEHVRAWTVQCLLERPGLSGELLDQLSLLALRDPSPVVRLYLASALQRLPLAQRFGIARPLVAHGEDADDPNIPLLSWYGIEPLVAALPEQAFVLARESRLEKLSRFVYRRAALVPELRPELVRLVGGEQDPARRLLLLEELALALREERGLGAPRGWPELAAEILRSPDERVRALALELAVAFGDREVFGELRAQLADRSGAPERRSQALDALVRGHDLETPALLQTLLDEPDLRGPVLRALANFDDQGTPRAILARYAALEPDERRDALATLGSRGAWARELLEALGRGEIARADLSAFQLRALGDLRDTEVDRLLSRHVGLVQAADDEKERRMAELADFLQGAGARDADLPRGREVFARTCQQCHRLFDAGGTLGPDLTGANRSDAGYLLSNVIDPSGIVGQDYRATNAWLADGRLVTGIERARSSTTVTLQTENELLTVPLGDIEELQLSELSAMPEGLLDALAPDEIRDLFAYLGSPAQVSLLATPANAAVFFDGDTLEHWRGDPAVWSVEEGEIVGRTEGLARNAFLASAFELRDFRLSLEVRLVGDAGNSGIQFRSRALAEGEVAGYQADIGPGWWGKLYEEHGRAVLVDQGATNVRLDGWNGYVIECQGERVRTWLNDEPCVDLVDPAGARSGIVALQVHSGGPTEVRFRGLVLEVLQDAGRPER